MASDAAMSRPIAVFVILRLITKQALRFSLSICAVFPTLVRVFLVVRHHICYHTSLPHARGVFPPLFPNIIVITSLPHAPWRCFKDRQWSRCLEKFSPRRGGVSGSGTRMRRAGLPAPWGFSKSGCIKRFRFESSPRPWGVCRQRQGFAMLSPEPFEASVIYGFVLAHFKMS